jgi:hypothetical protein
MNITESKFILSFKLSSSLKQLYNQLSGICVSASLSVIYVLVVGRNAGVKLILCNVLVSFGAIGDISQASADWL